MIHGLGTVGITCAWLSKELDLGMVRAACDEEELKHWTREAERASKALRTFANHLKRR
jgi:hypothetical protein